MTLWNWQLVGDIGCIFVILIFFYIFALGASIIIAATAFKGHSRSSEVKQSDLKSSSLELINDNRTDFTRSTKIDLHEHNKPIVQWKKIRGTVNIQQFTTYIAVH